MIDLTREKITELIEKLYQHEKDYSNSRAQDIDTMSVDCYSAAYALETLLQNGFDNTQVERVSITPATREAFLQRAADAVCGQREQDYGSPENNFATIAQLWTAYRGFAFDAVDVAVMMALLKIARIGSGHGSADSFIDLAGYAACGGELWAKTANGRAVNGDT